MRGDRDFSSRPRRRRPAPADLGLLGVGLLTLVVAGYATGTSWADLKRARQHVVDVRRQSEAAQARLRALESRSAPTAALATQALLSEEAAPPRVLADLSGLMPADVKLESMSLTYGEAIAIQMQVSSRSAGSYDAFLQRLEGSPLFDDVVPGEETRDGGVSASITARYRGPR
ncbi:MAG: hypothetical protein DMF78_20105 [Acidobacteria bacterium]|nr:MAG: hypothetical protein DMF78_20105 [Acidobacteriota bacterium]